MKVSFENPETILLITAWTKQLPQKNGLYMWYFNEHGVDRFGLVTVSEEVTGWVCNDGKVRIAKTQNGEYVSEFGHDLYFIELELPEK